MKPRSEQLFQKPKSEAKEESSDGKPGKAGGAKSSKESSGRGKKGGKREQVRDTNKDSNTKIVPENSSLVDENVKTDAKKRAASILAKFANTPNKKSIKTLIEQKSSETTKSPERKRDVTKSPGKRRDESKSPEKKRDEIKSPEKKGAKPTSRGRERNKIKSPENNPDDVKSPPRLRTLRSRVIEPISRSKTAKPNKSVHFEEEIKKSEERKTTRRTRATKLPAASTSVKPESDSDFEIEEKSLKKGESKGYKHITSESESEDEFELKPPPKKRKIVDSKKSNKDSARKSIDRRVLSSDEEASESVDAKGAQNIWIEVYVEAEESWISISIPDEKIHCVSEIYVSKSQNPIFQRF